MPGLVSRLAFGTAVSTLAVAGVLYGAPAGIVSTWRTQDVAINGTPDEWATMETLEKGPAVAAVNDDQFLYVVVSTTEANLRAVMATGLILWFDAGGGKAQTFGIWIPGIEQPLLPGMTPTAASAAPAGISSTVFDRFDLLGPGKNQRRLVDVTPALGIEIASGVAQAAFTYEVKVPLAKSGAQTYAIGAKAGATLGLGVATPEAPRGLRTGPMVGERGGRIGGNPYWGGANGGDFAPFAEREERAKPLALWTTLKLASK